MTSSGSQATGSQLTLVDLPELSRASTNTLPLATKVLHFTEDDITSTKISVSGDPSTHYVVYSGGQATRVVRVADGAPVRVGGIQRRILLPDLLTVGDFEMRLNQWLRMPLLYSM
ncbi:hypothetical protein PsYK624_095830 [Phanerochaete sordida]|uniref:Uncharacterized protein n=1 Tax=Phanerochaete sordida TaxID=48140 RepID=A0A9P3GGW8_9APHY|nr:hypothetical protein PsYK624_095830 [Phanerochaete sordida]